MERRIAYFAGQVQGVGFRYTTLQLASNRPITGYVRNLANGEVEVIVEGKREALEAFLDALTAKMAGYISDTRISIYPATGEFEAFGIKYC